MRNAGRLKLGYYPSARGIGPERERNSQACGLRGSACHKALRGTVTQPNFLSGNIHLTLRSSAQASTLMAAFNQRRLHVFCDFRKTVPSACEAGEGWHMLWHMLRSIYGCGTTCEAVQERQEPGGQDPS